MHSMAMQPTFVHTDKDFAEVTAASLAFGGNTSIYNHHLCLWHSLRAISQHISARQKAAVVIQFKAALAPYLHFLCDETEWIFQETAKSRVPQIRPMFFVP
ncbi:hypothetical protein V1508DRAFT_257514 [Lipomyces doorenjongii]|uniref:uncharacterized protein n=1 Tax=Lipomyces doorenjongii TaxID=383834 RepID=UPI0034CDB159